MSMAQLTLAPCAETMLVANALMVFAVLIILQDAALARFVILALARQLVVLVILSAVEALLIAIQAVASALGAC